MESNVYALVTERIIEKLNAGIIPWRKTWVSGPAKSLTTKKEYRGLNSLILRCSEFTSRYYVTYKQAKKLGGQVRKGEKATPVVYWHWRTPEEMAKLEASGKAKDASPCYPFISFVLNLDQVEGIERPGDDVPLLRAQTVEKAEGIVKEMPAAPEIKHGASFSPAYSLIFDLVEMPNIGQFESGPHYFSAIFHVERALRPIPMGRKNWLFCWSELGARTVGILQSLVISCKLQGLDPYVYLVDVLQRIDSHPAADVHLLTPRLWKENYAKSPMLSDLDRASTNAAG